MKSTPRNLDTLFAVACWCIVYAGTHGGNSPSLDEIADHFHVTKARVQRAINQMYKHGIAERIDGKLVMVGSTNVPPRWYIENTLPPVADEDLTEHARRNGRMISVVAV